MELVSLFLDLSVLVQPSYFSTNIFKLKIDDVISSYFRPNI